MKVHLHTPNAELRVLLSTNFDFRLLPHCQTHIKIYKCMRELWKMWRYIWLHKCTVFFPWDKKDLSKSSTYHNRESIGSTSSEYRTLGIESRSLCRSIVWFNTEDHICWHLRILNYSTNCFKQEDLSEGT